MSVITTKMKIIRVGLKANANFLFSEMKGNTLGGNTGGLLHASVMKLTIEQFEKLKSLIEKFGGDVERSLTEGKFEDCDFSCYFKEKIVKKIFVAYTEQGRVKGKISGSILKLQDKFQIITEIQFPAKSHRGKTAEVVSKLVEIGELPKEALDDAGYPNYKVVNEFAEIAIIEGQGLNYYSVV